jgi:hypothetical protein
VWRTQPQFSLGRRHGTASTRTTMMCPELLIGQHDNQTQQSNTTRPCPSQHHAPSQMECWGLCLVQRHVTKPTDGDKGVVRVQPNVNISSSLDGSSVSLLVESFSSLTLSEQRSTTLTIAAIFESRATMTGSGAVGVGCRRCPLYHQRV